MILLEALKQYQGHQVKLGADTSFIYCQICDENIFDLIKQMSDERFAFIHNKKDEYIYLYDNFENIWENRFKQRIEALQNNQKKRATEHIKLKHRKVKNIDTLVDKYMKLNKEKFDIEIKELELKLTLAKQDEYTKVRKNLKRYKHYCKIWKPYLEREVIEVYDSIIYDCKIIRFEGVEVGQYWDKDEYDKVNNK